LKSPASLLPSTEGQGWVLAITPTIHRHHLYWPNLDVDLEPDSLTNLAEYPLVYR
jgi:hypothetical protein